MKKIINKNTIFGFLIGIIITGSIGVLAVNYLYESKNVLYISDKTDKTNVKDVLNELYTKVNSNSLKDFILLDTLKTIFGNGIGTNIKTYDIKNYTNKYSEYTEDNFIVGFISTSVVNKWGYNSPSTASWGIAKNYDSSTGILTVKVTGLASYTTPYPYESTAEVYFITSRDAMSKISLIDTVTTTYGNGTGINTKTYDIKNYTEDYSRLNENDFIVEMQSTSAVNKWAYNSPSTASWEIAKNYDSSTGILTVKITGSASYTTPYPQTSITEIYMKK